MELTTDFLIKKFNLFNRQFFNNELPMIELKVSRTKRCFGQYFFSRIAMPNGVKEIPLKIAISKYWQMTSKEYSEVLIHEMIHYYLSLKNIGRNEDCHGLSFREKMNEINESSSFTISINGSSKGKTTMYAKTGKTSTILIFTLNGKEYFSKISKTLKDKDAIESKFNGVKVVKFIEAPSDNVALLKLRNSRLSLIPTTKDNLTKYKIAA